jgi:hypothetical protein
VGQSWAVTLPGRADKLADRRLRKGGNGIHGDPDNRFSPVCSARAHALRGQRRTADPIPNWLSFSTYLAVHPGGTIVKTCGSDRWLRHRPLLIRFATRQIGHPDRWW